MRGHLGVRLRRGQVDDRVDPVVTEQGVERRVVGAAETSDQLGRAPGDDVGAADELEVGLGGDRPGVLGGDVAAADERHPHRTQPRNSSSIDRHSSLGS